MLHRTIKRRDVASYKPKISGVSSLDNIISLHAVLTVEERKVIL